MGSLFNNKVEDVAHHSVYLDEQAVGKRWAEDDIRIFSILKAMESVEDWVISGDERVEEAIKRLSNTIEKHTDIYRIGSACRDFLIVFAYASSSRVMHILNCLDQRHHGSGLKMVQAAVDLVKRDDYDGAEGKLMVERLEILRRSKQLSRIFSQSRVRFVLRALKEVQNEG
ncbi:MAG: hypothetical protein CTY35_00410 [Methylotenera sp.]|uniref:type IVB secretion system protein IcmW n=1 Tax=Methylotenera sp. TaxID=2051956 RepID=UPI000D483FAB|nr:hypothetical protein [Methylotenera sp.]PPC84817.1 MAG: hypothetical protein CTY38_00405 [Methylotenera sp.]PPD02177.1 MAG: hypothetical protein CTY35_00410 [Methylotenera sp.]